MQLINAPDPRTFPSIEAALQSERIARYLPAAHKDKTVAFNYYLWNCLLCESFHVVMHFAEIVCRNALHNSLVKRCGLDWYNNDLFVKLLSDRFKTELRIALEQERLQHRDRVTSHHVVSALTFGFWEHLATKRFERFLWAKGIQNVFQHAPKDTSLDDVHALIESVRRWRNRIAHHRAIFDKRPMRKHQDALDLIALACPETASWVAAASKVPVAISLRPH
jgi:hypothetical protein